MYWLEAILSLLVIVDPIGNIPTFLGVTAGVAEEKRQRAFTVSVMVAAGILLVFLAAIGVRMLIAGIGSYWPIAK